MLTSKAPNQLVSLWEMLFKAECFVALIRLLNSNGMLLTQLDQLEKQQDMAVAAVSGQRGKRAKENAAMLLKNADVIIANAQDIMASLRDTLERMVRECERLDLPVSARTLRGLFIICRDNTRDLHFTDISNAMDVLQYEMESQLFLKIPSTEAKYYEEDTARWSNLTDKHPNLLADVDEAGKCLALGRTTACVFHLMRLMEWSVRLIAANLGIANVETSVWQKLCDQINKQIATNWPNPTGNAGDKAKRQEYNEALSLLYAVKTAWRNEVMHPKATYTMDEARALYDTTRHFMLKLVSLT